jgi:cytochrome c5
MQSARIANRGQLAAAAAVVLTMAGASADAQSNAAAEEPPPVFDQAFLNSPKQIEAGKAVWEAQCRHCHGNSAYPGKAPKLRPGSYTPDFIYDRVTYGFRAMPPWQAVFSVDERKAVVAYIKSDAFSP